MLAGSCLLANLQHKFTVADSLQMGCKVRFTLTVRVRKDLQPYCEVTCLEAEHTGHVGADALPHQRRQRTLSDAAAQHVVQCLSLGTPPRRAPVNKHAAHRGEWLRIPSDAASDAVRSCARPSLLLSNGLRDKADTGTSVATCSDPCARARFAGLFGLAGSTPRESGGSGCAPQAAGHPQHPEQGPSEPAQAAKGPGARSQVT